MIKKNAFEHLGLDPELVEKLSEGGYQEPTPIQAQAIPELLSHRDVIGQAQTGTGKTAAFCLPLIQKIDLSERCVQGLILCPTRELAIQVSDALSFYGRSQKLKVLTVYGGTPIQDQIRKLKAGVHVVVGTPGRVKDCLNRKALSLIDVHYAVLDEADEMLKMGFIEDVEEIFMQMLPNRQTALFSATLPHQVQKIADSYLRDPIKISIEQKTRTVEKIDQRLLIVRPTDKLNALARLIESESTDAILIFARTRAGCDRLVESLSQRGLKAAALHGDLSQDQREKIVNRLRKRRIQLVVATDIAARGLDVEGITHVINYDPPWEPEVYVHRIGRTGRAGREGVSILILTPREKRIQKEIEKFTGEQLKPISIPSNKELLKGRSRRLQMKVYETIERTDLSPYMDVLEEMFEREDCDPLEIAAALASLASKDNPLHITEPEPNFSKFDKTKSGKKEKRKREKIDFTDCVNLFVPVGKKMGIRPGDLVGAIANEAQIPGNAVGSIDIRDRVTFVDVASKYAPAVIQNLKEVSIRGTQVRFAISDPEKRSSSQKSRERPKRRRNRDDSSKPKSFKGNSSQVKDRKRKRHKVKK